MDKSRILLLALALLGRGALAQAVPPAPADGPPLTLAACYAEARQHYPLLRQLALNDEQAAARITRLKTLQQIPQVALNAQASYQTEVTRVPLDLPGVALPAVARDQYRLTLDLSQNLYDGGLTRQQQQQEQLGRATGNRQAEVGLYKVREQVDNLFFGVLLTDETSRLRQGLRTDLLTRRTALAARQRYGTATGQDLARLDAETLGLDQQVCDLARQRAMLLGQLGELLGRLLPPTTALELPAELPPAPPRPEWALYQQQRAQLAGQARLLDARLGPRLSAFGQAGYGRPGLNFFRNDLHAYGLGGLRLSWTLNGYTTRRQDQQLLQLDAEAVAVQQQSFAQSQRVALVAQQSAVDRYRDLLTTDQALITLREKVRATSAVQLANGIIGFADYFADANQLAQAQLNEQLHRLQLLQTQAALLSAQGGPAATDSASPTQP
ncbi:TolC family protein [Hymenobacter rubripertinctus]|uniref:TolC family protein n=1 Tax=Hymenobacter rubripertinctus TaxID=2029981 RepID=A0A418QR60_9BACT|nr:TolC family protein [Hymenobacter rubripertinctus]RIY07558.1 TolC family protein [Hymenobacter rubripertinctus]